MARSRRLLIHAAWASGGQLAQAFIGAVATVVLVRRLGPEAYGVFALGLLFVEFADTLVARHAADFIVRHDNLEKEHEAAAFVALTAVAMVAALLLAGIGSTAAELFATPSIAALLPVMGLLPLLTALTSVPEELLVRRLGFSALATIGTAASLCGLAVGVACAVGGAGVWSLVAMEATRRLARLIPIVVMAPWRPSVRFEPHHLKAVVSFGAKRVENKALQYVSIKAIPRFVVAQFLGPVALGYYTVARRILGQLNEVLNGPVASVGFPVVSRMKRGDPALTQFITRAVELSTWIVWPAMLGLALVAPQAIPLIYGDDWDAAVPVVQILALGFLRAPLSGIISAVLTGFGALREISRLQVYSVLIVGVLCAVGLPFGIIGIAAALAGRQWLTWPIGASYVQRITGFPVTEQLRLLVKAAMPSIAMTVVVFLAGVIADPALNPTSLLFAKICCGIVSYVFFWCLWNRVTPAQGLATLRAFKQS